MIQLLSGLALLLGTSRILGVFAKHFRQPAVLGELLAGLILGPTLMGRVAPGWMEFLFPTTGMAGQFFSGFISLAGVLILLVAGLEIDFGTLAQTTLPAVFTSISGIAIPFISGFAIAWKFPDALGILPGADPLVFSLFFATAMSISALPVIARTLIDLGLYKSRIGTVTMAAAIFDDIAGWIIFSVILSRAVQHRSGMSGVPAVIALTIGFTLFMMGPFRIFMKRALPWVKRFAGKTLSFCLCVTLLCAAVTDWIGIHALFGAFMAGASIGSAGEMGEKTRENIQSFVSSFFAPIFFASVALRVDFIQSFNPLLVGLVILVASACKIAGCGLAARLGGMSRNDAWGVGICMNARGAMEIVLGTIALQYGLIGKPLFVAQVVMAMVTSAMVAPLLMRPPEGESLRALYA